MQRRTKRIVSITLSFFLLFTSFAGFSFAEEKGKSHPDPQELIKKVRDLRKEALKDSSLQKKSEELAAKLNGGNGASSGDGTKNLHKPDDVVRVIIQLEEPSVYENILQQQKSPRSFAANEINNLSADIAKTQDSVLARIKDLKTSFREKYRFTRVINGISGEVKYKDIERLKKVPGVADVKIANLYYPTKTNQESTPDMFFSAPLIGAPAAWESQYDGDGTIIAILDTGVNYFHPAFGGNGKETLKLGGTEDLTEKGGYTPKVIGGFNWADGNNDIVDRTSSQHGVHVAGTAAGHDPNTKIDGKEFKGVAPGAKILAEKIFSNDPDRSGTMSDEIIAGIEHAIKYHADVINMSLGSPAGAVTPDDPELLAVERAVAAGVVVTISAGNEGIATDGLPFAQNPDFGMVGSPSVALSSISVAASMNTDALFYYFTLSEPIGNLTDVPMSVPEQLPSPGTLTGNYGIVDAGLGTSQDFDGLGDSVKGKVALIKRGIISFSEKISNAAKAGAVAAIIYNNSDTGYLNMLVNGDEGIPAGFILKADGEAIANELRNNPNLTISFGTSPKGFPLAGDTMTDFSSWGPEAGLNFKPTLTAPGGHIYSSIGDNDYASFDGTSMAAPHVAGASAVVIDSFRTNNRFPGYTAKDVRTVLSNTAKILINPATDTPYPVRQQGAGRIQVDRAVNTDVLVTDMNGEPGVTLKAFQERNKTFTLKLRNIGNTLYTYKLGFKGVYHDRIENGENTLTLEKVEGANVTFNSNTVTVPAKGTATVTVTLTLPDNLSLNQFVEGWVTFTADEATPAPELVVPFFGFYGDWNAPNVVDPHWSKADSNFKKTGLYDEEGYELGTNLKGKYSEGKDAFSPNGDQYMDQVLPVFSLLRNAETFQVNVLDKDKKLIRKLDGYNQLRKDDPENALPLTIAQPWDGTVNGKKVEDGQYYIQYLAKPYGVQNGSVQEVLFPVKVDTVDPSVSVEVYQAGGTSVTLKITGIDAGSGISDFVLFTYDPNGVLVDISEPITPVSDGKGGYTAEVADLNPDYSYEVVAMDYAGNGSTATANQLPFYYHGVAYSVEDEAAIYLNWKVDPTLTNISVQVDSDEPISVDPKVYLYGYPSPEALPLTYGDHTISIHAFAGDDRIFSVTDSVYINALVLLSDEKVTVSDSNPAQISYAVTSPRVDKVVFKRGGEQIGVQSITPGNAFKKLSYVYKNLPMGTSTLTIEAYAGDNLLGKQDVQVTRVKTYDIRFNEPFYFVDDQPTLEVGFSVSEDVYKAELSITDSNNAPVGSPIVVYDLSQSVTESTYSLDVASLSEGSYTLTLKPYDEDGMQLKEDTATLMKIPTGILSYAGSGYDRTNIDSYPLIWGYDQGASIPDDTRIYLTITHKGAPGGSVPEEVYFPAKDGNEPVSSYDLDLSGYLNGERADIVIKAKDSNGSVLGTLFYTVDKDLASPVWFVDTPAPYEIFNKQNSGGTLFAYTFDTDLDPSSVTLSIPGKESVPVQVIDIGYAYVINDLPFDLKEEGLQNVTLRFKDQLGNEGYQARKVFADFTPPEITLNSPGVTLTPVAGKEATYEANLTTTNSSLSLVGQIKENLSSFDFWVNDDKILSFVPSKAFVKDGVDQRTFSTIYPLTEGTNEITLKAVDGVGNESTVLLHVTKVNSPEPPSGGGSGGGGGGGGGVVTTPGTTTTEETPAGKVTTTTKADGTVEAKVEVSAQAVTDQLNKAGVSQVVLDLTKVDLTAVDQLALTIDQETTKKLLESGKGITIQNNGVDIEIPAALLSSFVGADGTFTFTIKVEEAKKEEGVIVEAVSGATIVSPILSIGEAGTALKEPITLTLKLKDGAAKDVRKVGPYSRTTSGKWTYVGNLKGRHGNTFTVKTSTLGTFALIEYAKSFDDIANHWAKDAVEVMASQNIVKGSSANTFNPEGKVTRAEFATMLVRALGLSTKGAYTGQFTDVKEGDWFAGSVEAAAKAGIIQGSGGKFNPNASVTREEMTVMLIRALGMADQAAGLTPSFSDAGSIATWAKEAVALAQQKGLISGVGNNLFAPKGTSKRAEAATILFRLMETLQK